MQEEYGCDRIAIDPGEGRILSFCQYNQTENKASEQYQYGGRAQEALFLTDGTEDEIGVLFGYIL